MPVTGRRPRGLLLLSPPPNGCIESASENPATAVVFGGNTLPIHLYRYSGATQFSPELICNSGSTILISSHVPVASRILLRCRDSSQRQSATPASALVTVGAWNAGNRQAPNASSAIEKRELWIREVTGRWVLDTHKYKPRERALR